MFWKRYIKWRHSKGYGVHSPFAFRFVTDVLRPGEYALYSYWEIEKQLKGEERHDYRLVRKIKFLLRLAVFLKSGRIVAVPEEARLAQIAAGSLNLPWRKLTAKDSFELHKGDLLLIGNKPLKESVIDEAIKKEVAVFALNPSAETKNLLLRPLSRGLLFRDSHRFILIPRLEMTYTSYEISLRFR